MIKDSDILQSIRSGNDSRALSCLYETTLRKVRQYIFKNSGNKEEANDIFQDALIIFFNQVKQGKFNEEYSIDAFIYSVARNLWINKVRRDKKTITSNDITEFEKDTEPDHLSYLISKERSKAVNNIFSQLDEKCQKILHYFNHEKMSMLEISEKMGYTSENVAKTIHYRCKKYLMKLVTENNEFKNLFRN